MGKEYVRGKFTSNALEAINSADGIARKLNHEYIGTEHLLLGLAKIKKGRAYEALDAQLLDYVNLFQRVTTIIEPGQEAVTAEKLRLSPRFGRVIMRAKERVGEGEVGTQDLLYGIIQQDDGIAYLALVQEGAKISELESLL